MPPLPKSPIAVRSPTPAPPPPASQAVSSISPDVKEVKEAPFRLTGTRNETKVLSPCQILISSHVLIRVLMFKVGDKLSLTNLMRCPIWHYLYQFKKHTFSKVAAFKPAPILKVTLLHGGFLRFLNCTNDAELGKHLILFLV